MTRVLALLLRTKQAYAKTVREFLEMKGFDPDNINKKVILEWTPKNYFGAVGNFKMCRDLWYSCGADGRNTDMLLGRFPMFPAASFGHLEIVQWLSHLEIVQWLSYLMSMVHTMISKK